eukprot:6468729-Amphidinium_carterae.1
MGQRGVRRAPAHQRGAQAQRQAEQRATASSAIAPPTRTTTTTSRTRSPRERTNSPRRATTLHPHLDDYPEFYSDGTLPSDDDDITWEDESGEEEAREHDEVDGEERVRQRVGRYVDRSDLQARGAARATGEVRFGAYINPPVIVARDLPVEEVRRIPRPNIVDPQQPPSDPATEQDDYSLGSDQADSVVENLASSGARARARGFQPQRRDNPRHPPLTVHGHVVIDDE